MTDDYKRALRLLSSGPVAIVVTDEGCVLWHTPLREVAPHLWIEPLHPDPQMRVLFLVGYTASVGHEAGDR